MSEVTIPQLEAQKESAKDVIAQRDQVTRLANNPDFKKLIIDGFMKEECARYTHASADPNLRKEERDDALAMAQAAGHLKRFLNQLIVMGNRAEKDIHDIDEAIEELRQMGEDH